MAGGNVRSSAAPIEREADGIRLHRAARVVSYGAEADVIVTATGLNLLAFGGVKLSVDGRDIEMADSLAYKGMMLGGVPNYVFTVGYTNASWTLKADLVSEYVNRLLTYMDEHGYVSATPTNDDPTIETRPLMDFAAGYVQRSLHELPKQGSRAPWQLGMNYAQDVITLRHGKLDDGVMRFSRGPVQAPGHSARNGHATANGALNGHSEDHSGVLAGP